MMNSRGLRVSPWMVPLPIMGIGGVRKQHKYGPLIEELVREGWDVDSTVHVITVGVIRATVPTRNIEVLEKLGIKDNPAQQKV